MMAPMNRRELLLWPTLFSCGPSQARDDAALLSRLRSGGVAVLLRHATTDAGIGDPPGFEPGVCATQRNLSDGGRREARRIGAWFDERGLRPAAVRSSAWCRCLDTATIAFGRVEPWPALDSFFGDARAEAPRTRALQQALGRLQAGSFEVWVTHMVNIARLSGESVSMGEALVMATHAGNPPSVQTLGRLRFEA